MRFRCISKADDNRTFCGQTGHVTIGPDLTQRCPAQESTLATTTAPCAARASAMMHTKATGCTRKTAQAQAAAAHRAGPVRRAARAHKAAIAAAASASARPAARPVAGLGECAVCGETPVELLAATCTHAFCAGCWAGWVGARLEQLQRRVPCPHTGCAHALTTDDVARVAPALAAGFAALAAQTFEPRPELAAAVAQGLVRACPGCSVLIARDEGCNTVHCPCGRRFCFCCGQEHCHRVPAHVLQFLREQQMLYRLATQPGAHHCRPAAPFGQNI